MIALLSLVLSTGAGKDIVLTDANIDRLLDAIWYVESGCRNGPIKGDGGNALGPMQIWRAFWQDAVEFSGQGGKYEDVADIKYAKKTVRNYWTRYCTERRVGRKPTIWHAAVMVNGGPNAHKASGKKKANLVKYWDKVWARYQALGG
tara:strand:- start:388 stop:828 length:441 start_codon:yes stop_codon:yes gene_type:complete